MTCRWLTALVAVAALLGICSVAHANSLSPYVWFWPGIVSVTFVYAFPASLLAAFIERPFLTAAGLKNRALVLSLRANFLSAVVGLLLIPVGYPALLVIGPLWCIIAFGLSCTVEIFYLRDFSRRLAWGWIVGGNAVSSIVLMTLPPIALVLKQNYYRLAWSLEPHEVWLNWSSLIASLTLFLTSFAWPIRRATACEATALGESDATAEVADQGQSIQT